MSAQHENQNEIKQQEQMLSTEARHHALNTVREALGLSATTSPDQMVTADILLPHLFSSCEEARKSYEWEKLPPPILYRKLPLTSELVEKKGMSWKTAMDTWKVLFKQKEEAERRLYGDFSGLVEGSTLEEVISQMPEYVRYLQVKDALSSESKELKQAQWDAMRAIIVLIENYPDVTGVFFQTFDSANPKSIWESEGKSNCIGKLVILTSLFEHLNIDTSQFKVILSGFHSSLAIPRELEGKPITTIIDYNVHEDKVGITDMKVGLEELEKRVSEKSIYAVAKEVGGYSLIKPESVEEEDPSYVFGVSEGLAASQLGQIVAQRRTFAKEDRHTLALVLSSMYPDNSYLAGQVTDSKRQF